MATDLAKQELIGTYLERGLKPGRAEYRIVNTGIPIWAIVGQLRVEDWNVAEVARQYAVPVAAVEAVLAYYHMYQPIIDDRLMQNEE